MKVAEKIFGSTHPNFATALNNLAVVYKVRGRYVEAEPLYKQALAIYEKAFGENHPSVATVCKNMADLYRGIGKEDEAERLEERARKIRSNR